MKKLLILICILFSLVITGCSNSEVESSSYVDEGKKPINTVEDLEEYINSDDSNNSDEDNDDSEENENYDDSDDYDNDYDYTQTKEDELGELADIVASQVPSDFKVTYQYETSDMTGYIFLTWMGASDLSRSELNDVIDASGVKETMQDLANSTSEELDRDVCIVLRDMSNKTLYSCYND